jgi:DNA transformation protein
VEPPAGFADFVLEMLEPMGGVNARRMFGRIGSDTLYLKVDEQNRGAYEDAGTGPFTYRREGREIALSYYEAPPDLFDSADDLSDWARGALDAALRAQDKGARS